MSRIARVGAKACDARAGSDQCDLLVGASLERQEAAAILNFVLEQTDRALSCAQSQLAGLGVVGDVGGIDLTGVRVLEEPGAELQREYPHASCIDVLRRDQPGACQSRQIAIGRAVRELAVHARMERARGRGRQVCRHVVQRLQVLDRVVVAYHRAAELPFAPQHVVQQPAVDVRGQSVDLVVGRHDGGDVRAPHHLAKRREKVLAQLALAEHGRPDVFARLWLTVTGQVLERGEDIQRLQRTLIAGQARHGGHPHFRADMRTLAESLFDTPPARIAGHVDDR